MGPRSDTQKVCYEWFPRFESVGSDVCMWMSYVYFRVSRSCNRQWVTMLTPMRILWMGSSEFSTVVNFEVNWRNDFEELEKALEDDSGKPDFIFRFYRSSIRVKWTRTSLRVLWLNQGLDISFKLQENLHDWEMISDYCHFCGSRKIQRLIRVSLSTEFFSKRRKNYTFWRETRAS